MSIQVQGSIPKPEHIPVPVVAEVPPTDIASRSDTYTGLLSKLTLASDHRQNLRNRGLSDEEIDRLGYRTSIVCIQIENAAGEPTARTAKYILLQIDVEMFCVRLVITTRAGHIVVASSVWRRD